MSLLSSGDLTKAATVTTGRGSNEFKFTTTKKVSLRSSISEDRLTGQDKREKCSSKSLSRAWVAMEINVLKRESSYPGQRKNRLGKTTRASTRL